MSFDRNIVLLSLVLLIAGCSAKSGRSPSAEVATAVSPANTVVPATTPSDATEVKPKLDACALLTGQEIESVQGEALRETKLSGQSTGGFSTSQCFFTLPTFTNSISLLVVQSGKGPDAREAQEIWRDTFHKGEAEDKDDDRYRKRESAELPGEQEEAGAPAKKVRGVGDEAYWTGNRMGGALYVLKGTSYLRISIGSVVDQAIKIQRSKTLAQKAIARL